MVMTLLALAIVVGDADDGERCIVGTRWLPFVFACCKLSMVLNLVLVTLDIIESPIEYRATFRSTELLLRRSVCCLYCGLVRGRIRLIVGLVTAM